MTVLSLCWPTLSSAHGGGLSTLGCHNNNTEGVYECHRGEYAGMTFTSREQFDKFLSSEFDWTTAKELCNDSEACSGTIKVGVYRGSLTCIVSFRKPQNQAKEDYGVLSGIDLCRNKRFTDLMRPGYDEYNAREYRPVPLLPGTNPFEYLQEHRNESN